MRTALIKFLPAFVLLASVVTSCTQTHYRPIGVVHENMSPYEKFVTRSKKYPTVMEIYLDDELIEKADPKSPVIICLSQQRGRLYVDNKVAADWPVSTGADTHPTPTGRYRVCLKKEEHASNRYGKLYDENNKCIDSNADVFTNPVPEGCRFVGASMPNWMRLTSDGVGMHTGKVEAGKRLSHGCIRLPHTISTMLFKIVDYGTRVTIMEDIEPNYPVAEIMAQREIAVAESAAEAQPEE